MARPVSAAITSCVSLFLVFLASAHSQSVPTPALTRDPQALTYVGRMLAAAGGREVLDAVQDFTATGTITYYWAGQPVKGQATIRGRGLDQLTLQAVLPSGTRSWTINHGKGVLKETDGTAANIPFHNTIALRSLLFPYARLLEAVKSAGISVSYVGMQQMGSTGFHQIRLNKFIIPNVAPGSAPGRLGTFDVFLDASTFQLLGIHDYVYPTATLRRSIPHALYFSDYRTINGISVPFTVSERVNGQEVWSLALASFTFNTGLSDGDFQF